MIYFVIVNDTKFDFDTLSGAIGFFNTFKDFDVSSYKVSLYENGLLINKNY